MTDSGCDYGNEELGVKPKKSEYGSSDHKRYILTNRDGWLLQKQCRKEEWWTKFDMTITGLARIHCFV